MADDKTWAKGYILDPLNEPDPSDATGPNSHFRSTFEGMPESQRVSVDSPPVYSKRNSRDVPIHQTGETISTNPYRRSFQSFTTEGSTRSRSSSTTQHSPQSSASPRRGHFHSLSVDSQKGKMSSMNHPGSPKKDGTTGLRRGNSLSQRYPGDMSHRPLDQLVTEQKQVNRSPHLQRRHQPQPDLIDRLDRTGFAYHHGGPFDAALLARNSSWESSPVAALTYTNKEALKATPRENIEDALKRHRPLDGVATVPPGMADRFGRVYKYEEGIDLNRERGADYKRYPGMEYHPDDLKGKGEPSYTIEKALKEHKITDNLDSGVEMQTRPRGKSTSTSEGQSLMPMQSIGRSNTTGRKVSEGLKRRFGSVRRRKQSQEV